MLRVLRGEPVVIIAVQLSPRTAVTERSRELITGVAGCVVIAPFVLPGTVVTLYDGTNAVPARFTRRIKAPSAIALKLPPLRLMALASEEAIDWRLSPNAT